MVVCFIVKKTLPEKQSRKVLKSVYPNNSLFCQ